MNKRARTKRSVLSDRSWTGQILWGEHKTHKGFNRQIVIGKQTENRWNYMSGQQSVTKRVKARHEPKRNTSDNINNASTWKHRTKLPWML